MNYLPIFLNTTQPTGSDMIDIFNKLRANDESRINLHIERLVLGGVDIAPGQQHLLQTSVTTEVTRMLSEGGVSSGFAADNALSRLKINSNQLNESNNPTQNGQQIVCSVYKGISNE